jgi:hypothetical protein
MFQTCGFLHVSNRNANVSRKVSSLETPGFSPVPAADSIKLFL